MIFAHSPLVDLRSQPFFEDKNRAFWMLQSVGWTGYFVLRALGGLANSMGLLYIVPTALATVTGYSITLLMSVAYRRLIHATPVVTWSISIFILVAASGIFSMIEVWAHATFYRSVSMPVGIEFLGAILLDFALLIAWSALYYGINYYLMLEKHMGRIHRIEAQASAAQLAMLRYQLNPHFLFNTLNSISTLVLLKQTSRANAMLSRLSSFLRYTLANEPTAMVTLEQEVETLKLYLEIEKMRFEERLRPHFDIDPDVAQARLPSLLLQPLIENAIKYAVTPCENGADISLSARFENGHVRIDVVDSGPGVIEEDESDALEESASIKISDASRTSITTENLKTDTVKSVMTEKNHHNSGSTGVGLPNIRDRLFQAYGTEQSFQTFNRAEGGFAVVIEIPYQTEDKTVRK
ncbi:histidine kinase [Zymomonas mobilis subsp. pomaceae]|uniref:Signal transduction histidine kinase, LytS n=1 Tax=Zymomonas mobilis subsp. pomaceae (strain ATCC 29192 / DSM 22645 / JCM 10191 / CCUG 17912 / NBRC 13757 / NCIMB 11200 / NRRL B-4491 / Barker I) TaxID=579138 RepID=F8EV51_ZYMMT|nr:signal transduction histidine kinase, LytS [Zymomonas mobilis subsp. pomaceae ATCC 29192]GEB89287.1 histidine kinase [Zymomonas mobilis subsp. pomaceae]